MFKNRIWTLSAFCFVFSLHLIFEYNKHLVYEVCTRGFPGGTSGQEPACQCRRYKGLRLDPWVGKIAWRKAWQPLKYFCLENPTDRGAWQAIVCRVTESLTRLKRLSTCAHMQVCTTRTNHIFEERLLSSKFSGLYQKC